MTPEQIEYRDSLRRLIAMREMAMEIFRKTLDPATTERPDRDQIQAANALITHCRQEGMDLEILRQQDVILAEIGALRNPERNANTERPESPDGAETVGRTENVPAEPPVGTPEYTAVVGNVQGEPEAQT